MGQHIVKQPDGKYAIWDSEEDYFTAQNLTSNDAVDYMVGEIADYARTRARWRIEDIQAGKDSIHNWDNCCELMAITHGDDDD